MEVDQKWNIAAQYIQNYNSELKKTGSWSMNTTMVTKGAGYLYLQTKSKTVLLLFLGINSVTL